MSHSSTQEFAYDANGKAHPVVDFNNDREGALLGFWIFLLNEFMLFGAVFMTFFYFWFLHTVDFAQASASQNLLLGTINTVILIISTFTMGVGLKQIASGNADKAKGMLLVTMLISVVFLGIKAIEWGTEISHGIYPGSDVLARESHGIVLYWGLYFSSTALHALHVIAGIIVMIWLYMKISDKSVNSERYVAFENIALYWDFVHLVWVFLFPALYLLS